MAAISSIPARGWLALVSAIIFFALSITASEEISNVDESLLLSAGLASAALLWFVGTLSAEIRRREGADGTFAAVALGSGILVVAFAGLGAALRVVPSLGVSEDAALPNVGSAAFVEVANNELIHIGTFWRGSLMAAVALIMVRSAGPGRWYGGLSAVLAAASFLGGLSFVASPVVSAATAVGFASYIAFHFWVALGGVVLAALSRSLPGTRRAQDASR